MNYKGIIKRQTFIIVVSVLCLTVAIIGASYALFFSIQENTNNHIVTAGDLEVNFGTNGDTITADMLPMSDADGMAQIGYNFSITNTGTLPGKYYIAIYDNTTGVSDVTTLLDHRFIRVSIDGSEPQTLSEVVHTDETKDETEQSRIHYQLLSNGVIIAPKSESDTSNVKTHNLKVWINEEADTDIIGKLIKLQLEVVSIVAKGEDLPNYADASGAEAPILDNGLIPVVYQDNKWVKANLKQKWYDYDIQMWANAVTVKEANQSTYVSAVAGTEIPMDVINTMWVWIPRYEYQTDNLTYIENNTIRKQYAGGFQPQPGAININFVSKKATTASASNFTIHPAFTFGAQQLPGMWVAKFEMSPQIGTICATTSNETNCDVITFAPEIKPSVPSWRYARLGTYFTAIQNQMNGEAGTTTYGFTNSDVHMMKNMEWGAVAYLSQSKYGKYGNASYTGADKEVVINNCQTGITGVGGNSVSASSSSSTCTTNTYETAKGQAASTTGNIYGIYDMSGGAYEFVMGVMKESTNTEVAVGDVTSYISGFSGKRTNGTDYTGTYGYLKDIDTMYYDVYDYGTTNNDATAYQRGHLGDGTTEVAGWYFDSVRFVDSDYPWFIRGGDRYGESSAGIFAFSSDRGYMYTSVSSRPVLVSATS